MKLLLVGHAGSRACDWSGYALLRDNVQHYLEAGEPTQRFAALHGIERAVDSGRCLVEAARLRGEVLRAWYALWAVPMDRAAVSLRTRAILIGSTELPTARGTVRARHVGWELPVDPGGSLRVPEAAKRFVTAVLAVTERVVDGNRLEIHRYGAAPRFAEQTHGAAQAPPLVRRPTVMGLALKGLCVGLLAIGCTAGWTPPIVAPPPAYGNKVVRPQASQTVRAGSPQSVLAVRAIAPRAPTRQEHGAGS